MLFWQGFAVLSCAAILFILWPTIIVHLNKRKKELMGTSQARVHEVVYDDQLKELEATHGRGEIEKEELEILKEDLHKTHIFEASQVQESEQPIIANWKSRIPVILLAFAVPLVTLVIYFQIGAKQDWDIYQLRSNFYGEANPSEDKGHALIKALQNRLEKKPQNSHNWYLLGATAMRIGDYEEAVRAFRELDKLEPQSPVVLAELAQAHFRWAGSITPEVRSYIKQTLALQEDYPSILGLAGVDAFQNARFQEAIDFWSKAVSRINPHSAEYSALQQGIEQAKSAMLARGETPKHDGANEMESSGQLKIAVRVSLGDAVEAAPDDTVFVYARAWQGARIPLAIQKLQVADLPKSLALDETMAMDPSRGLASAAQVEVVARISKSGSPVPQAGDWQVSAGPVTPGENTKRIDLVISSQVEQ